MIVDGHVHITEVSDPVWRRAPFPADALISLIDEPIPVRGEQRVIDWAAAMPTPGVTTLHELSFRQQHQAVIDAVRNYPERLVGTFMLNPCLGVQAGIEELRRLVGSGGFRMLKLHPTIHNFWPYDQELVYPLLEEAAALQIPVLFHMREPPYSIPSLLERVAKDHPNVAIVIAHLSTQKICYADDAVNVADHCPNVYLETGWGPMPRLIEAVQAIGPDRLVLGSDSPTLDIFSQVRNIECLTFRLPLGVGLSDDDMEKILGNNLARLLRLAEPSSG